MGEDLPVSSPNSEPDPFREAHRRPLWLVHVVEAALVVVGIIALPVAIGIAMDAKHGNIAEWVSALGTLAAVVAAIQAGKWARRAYQHEVSKTEQQNLVAAWLSEVVEAGVGNKRALRPGQVLSGCIVQVRNLSDLPVRNVLLSAEFVHAKADGTVERYPFNPQRLLQVAPTSSQPDRAERTLSIAEKAHIFVPGRTKTPEQQETAPEFFIEVSIRFTDTKNRTWLRDGLGALHRL